MHTSLGRVLVAACLLIGGTLVTSAAPAGAHHAGPGVGDPTCPHAVQWGSTACLYGVVHFGTYAEWHNNYMAVEDGLEAATGAFVGHAIWAYSGTPCGQYFMEIGLTTPFTPIGGPPQVNSYVWYVAKVNVDGYWHWNMGNTVWDGSNHAYRLRYDGNASYSARRDGITLAQMGGFGWGSCMSQGGIEIAEYTGSGPDWRTLSHTFNFYPLAYQNTAYGYIYGWNTSQYWIDYPCNPFGTPNCFNGLYYNQYHWADNKF